MNLSQNPGNRANTMEKKYVISVRNYAQEFKLSGMQFMCRFDEPSRIVFVGADTMLIGTKGLQFSNHTWIVVTPSPTDPVRSSVVHMCVRLSVDRVEEVLPIQKTGATRTTWFSPTCALDSVSTRCTFRTG